MRKARAISKQAILKRIYQTDFIAFVSLAFKILHHGRSLQQTWHIEVMAHELHGCLRGKQNRLAIHAPPRSLKSFVASVAFPAFALGRDPTRKVMSIVANQVLADDICSKLCRLLNSDEYHALFPHVSYHRKRDAILLSHGGSFISSAFSSSPIGRGADILIVDDPVSPSDAKSETFNRKADERFTSEIVPRLNDKASSIAVLVMQRLSRDDLCGAFFRGQPREVLVFTAIARQEERWLMPDGTIFIREPRTVLNPKRETIEQIRAVYDSMPYGDFCAQYLQDVDANRCINGPMFYDFDTTDWTPEKGWPKSKMLFSNQLYVHYECFGDCEIPPYISKDPLTEDQRDQGIRYSQEMLLKEMAKDLE